MTNSDMARLEFGSYRGYPMSMNRQAIKNTRSGNRSRNGDGFILHKDNERKDRTPTQRLRVLVVDDNEAHRFIIKEMLDAAHHQTVAEAEDLAGTLEAYEKHQPDVILLDLSLAKDDGITILKALWNSQCEARVLIVSANTQKIVRDQCFELGASGILNKPFKPEELDQALARLCQR